MPSIDISGVPNDKRNRPDYILKYSLLRERLKSPEHIREVCIHEAGHFIQAAQLGVAEESFKFAGSRIVYNRKLDNFDVYSASINLKTVKVNRARFVSDEAIFLAIAALYAAGGVHARILANSIDPGDSEDREAFHMACLKVPQFAPRESEFWTEAQDALAKLLQDESNRERAFKVATDLKPLLFPEQ